VAASDSSFGIFKLFLLFDCLVAASDNPFVSSNSFCYWIGELLLVYPFGIFKFFLILDCRVAASDNPFGIFKLSSFYWIVELQLLITPLVSSNSSYY